MHLHLKGLYRVSRASEPAPAHGPIGLGDDSGLKRLVLVIGDWAEIAFWLRLPLTLLVIGLAGLLYMGLAYVLGAIDMRNLGSLRHGK